MYKIKIEYYLLGDRPAVYCLCILYIKDNANITLTAYKKEIQDTEEIIGHFY